MSLGGAKITDTPTLQSALTDHTGFVTGVPGLQVIDEVQRAGEPLVLAIKHAMDRSDQPGQFLLAGSTRFLDNPGLTESLAGRLLIQDLLPFSQGEICGRRERFLSDAMGDPLAVRAYLPQPLNRDEYLDRICLGGYPEPLSIDHPGTRIRWFDSYVRAVVDRDLREMARVREPAAADQVLRSCAALTGQEFNTVTLSQRAGRSRATVDRYVRLLEAAFLVHRLPPYTRNDLTRAAAGDFCRQRDPQTSLLGGRAAPPLTLPHHRQGRSRPHHRTSGWHDHRPGIKGGPQREQRRL
ncbi:MAG: AAA family ATPase [Candidatus Nanopelagicales bacterium]|nr:AAA family ATPase [Candidatus Nanopelagicales bacterium]